MIDRRNFLTLAGVAAGSTLILPTASLAQADISPEAVFHDPKAPALGNPDGDITLVEYFDYQCPYCKSNHPVVEKVTKEDGNLRVVMKDWPIFGAPSVYASQLVLGAQSMGQYEAGLEALMATQGKLSNDLIEKTLSEAGVDPDKAMAGYKANRKEIDALLSRNDAQAVAIGLRGTPAYIVGRDVYPGAVDADTLRKAISDARQA
ncbi:disulfide bond formation protein DsbA [Thioclava sediminum]|uniref:Disulfide bond formation protein DsbA n=1 Tax=Thioclava sediminum TaxID=1915319 RepID=A0ABX3N2I5_9RHOB|nr:MULTISPECIES: DsbA family protein [Thioclava]OOY18112.1 disulfide bond formation protein DsbA [Thioclava sp. DLFJ4-1]OOY25629.1 disulfide bond formation protein DsbA [Thioclava sediminum]